NFMRSILANPDALFRFQKGLLPSFCLFFTWALTLIFIEVDKQPRLNETAFLLLGIMLAALAVSFIWARIEYAKVLILMEKLQSVRMDKVSFYFSPRRFGSKKGSNWIKN
ncbi:hypothetical protein M3O96_00005, partial [Aquiflexum sp. TKW24L]|uniref:hypothetical protein n=1 Tax=Aquiflexum sp. TKW24L TaxID=2942212 RepID=UPI0020C110B2